MPTKTKYVRKVRIDGVVYPYTDAKRDVVVERRLVDVWQGKPGVAGECMNAKCIMRNRAKFPHKVLAVSVMKSRVFIFDSLNHVIRYTLSQKDSALIGVHDEEALSQPGTLVLRAPRGKDRAGQPHHRTSRSKNTSRPKKTLARGEKARLWAAVGSSAT